MPGTRRGGQGARSGKPGSSRKGSTTGSGGHGRKRLAGRGATPPAEQRPGHPAQRRSSPPAGGRPTRPQGPDRGPEILAGRNAVVEALRSGVPAMTLYAAVGIDADQRVSEAVRTAGNRRVPLLEVPRTELDRLTGGVAHQGLALQVPAYRYPHPDDLLARVAEAGGPGLVVALDGVTDPRNLGAVARSAAAFGAHGLVVPERRAAGVTAAAWKASAGAVARLPVARATNLVRTLTAFAEAGLLVIGLDADGEVDLDDLEAALDPLVLVVGSEGRGLSRLVRGTCDLTVRIPMVRGTESLNAGVAVGVALAEIARRRRLAE
jgi:23S rRNA (guanosine2251-2'-O)-methyltransferase